MPTVPPAALELPPSFHSSVSRYPMGSFCCTALPTSLPALQRMQRENFPVASQSVIWRGSRLTVTCISP